jgi:pimeloyl-ACP methyl ester carboxylesterase
MTIFFLHGLDSSGNGTKGRYFGEHFPEIQRPDFTGTLAERMEQLEQLVTGETHLRFIGSSFGGLMATCFAKQYQEKVTRLILLAPALNFAGFTPPRELVMIPTLLIIGEHDTVTPPHLVLPLAKATFGDLDIRLMDDDHLLHQTFADLDWQQLLAL